MRGRLSAVFTALLTMIGAFAVGAPAAAGSTMPVYNVVGIGMTSEQAAAVERILGVDGVRDPDDRSFQSISQDFGSVPMKEGTGGRRDEGGGKVARMAFDLPAIRAIKPFPRTDAMEKASDLLGEVQLDLPGEATPQAGNTQLRFMPRGGRNGFTRSIDTFVRYSFELSGVPLIGPGAKAGMSFDAEGNVTHFQYNVPHLEPGEQVPLIDPAEAKAQCAERYPRGARIQLGMVYVAPTLSEDTRQILPYYECRGTTRDGARLVPATVLAVPEVAPTVSLTAEVSGAKSLAASVRIRGGTRPYRIEWYSASGSVDPERGRSREASLRLRPTAARADRDILYVTVRDANGIVATDSQAFRLPASLRLAPSSTSPAAVGPVDVGGEFNVYEWDCVKQSSSGFQSRFNAAGIPVAFRWNAPNAWEQDFRDTNTQGGDDKNYVDNVDLAWYTGHGNPNSFSFDNSAHDDGSIVVSDARWGDRDLEWLQLESCNVLQFENASGTKIWDRWAKTLDGLHMLNGFQTTASCVDVSGGTAGRFSAWLLGLRYPGIVPPLRVRVAWALMAIELEPAGKQYVSMGAVGAGGLTNYDDYFWGKGPVGPDIPKSQITAYWWVYATV